MKGVKNTLIDRIGEIRYNNRGSRMEIIKYTNALNMVIKFDNGYTVKCAYGDFKRGKPKSPYEITVFGKGYLGEGEYKNSIGDFHTKEYDKWKSMLQRCYYEKTRNTYLSYDCCEVCNEWLNFQNFAEWYYKNYYEIDGEKMSLDKDILNKGNKVYNSNDCIFVPERINSLFVKRKEYRGDYPIGVCENGLKYASYYDRYIDGKSKKIYLGSFNNPIKAFNAYKEGKEAYIKEVAEDYKDKIPERLYIAMMNYKVEITD